MCLIRKQKKPFIDRLLKTCFLWPRRNPGPFLRMRQYSEGWGVKTVKVRVLIILTLILASGGFAAEKKADMNVGDVEGPRITDAEFFDAINLDYGGLEKVKAAVETSDIAGAKHEFAQYLRNRKKPVWRPDWLAGLNRGKRNDKTDTREADRILQRDLPSVGVYHKYEGRIDWSLDPINYREWPFQLNRHSFWTTLGLAYLATGEEKYVEEFVYQMTDWVKQCPVPINDSGNRGVLWRTIEQGIRMGQTWPAAYYLFLGSPSFTDDAMVTMVTSMVEHARQLMEYPTTANWLTMECNGLMHVGVLFPEFKEAEQWRKVATDRLFVELDKQVYPDGAQIELSTGYHQISLDNFAMAWEVANINGISMPEAYIAKMEKMFDYNLHASMPNGYLPGLNDAGLVNVKAYAGKGLKYFPDRKDYLWLATLGKEGTKPTVDSIALPFSGHIIMRSGWEADARYMLFDAGPFGYGHQHEDALSFVIFAYGKYMLIDPGNYPYDNSKWRKYVLSTRAHNTIMVDGCEQHRRDRPRQEYVLSQPMPIKWASGKKYDYASSVYADGYARDNSVKVEHERTVFFVKPDYWIVTDKLTPEDDKPHKYESMFHLDMSGVEVDAASGASHTTDADGANLTIRPARDSSLSVKIITGQEEPFVQGWIRLKDYECRPIPTAAYEKEQAGVTRMAYVFYPTPEGAKCPVRSVEYIPVQGGEGVALAIDFGDGKVDYFALSDSPGEKISFGQFKTDSRATYLRTVHGKIADSIVCGHAIRDLSKTTTRHVFE